MAERCLAVGERCPKRLKHGKRRVRHTCNANCCTRFSALSPDGKRRCACRSEGAPCTTSTARQCCSQVCAGGVCTGSPPEPGDCTAQGETCTGGAAACCTGVCNAGASTTGPLAGTANACATCLSGRATCDPNNAQCCDGRECVDIPGNPPGQVCESATGEQCRPDPGATATDPAGGTCAFSLNDICPVPGNVGATGICCRASGSGYTGSCDVCCTGECTAQPNFCCAPAGTDPRLSGGTPCLNNEANASCCGGACAALNSCA
jgi:hypothetical protein